MAAKTRATGTAVSKGTKVVPEWAKKVKAYREGAGKTQIDIQKVIKAKTTTMNRVETGRRKFTPLERKLFFELIGKPEDTSIPLDVRAVKTSTPKKETKPAKSAPKRATKNAKIAKIAKPAKPGRPATSAKAGKTAKASGAAKTVPPASAKKAKVPASSLVRAEPRNRRGRKPSVVSAPIAVPKTDAKPVAKGVPQGTRKPRIPKPVGTAPAKSGAVRSAKSTTQALSPVKDAVLRDITRILGNPGLSDNHAQRLHGLFTALAVNSLMGE
jgi:DNA-binding XRE family transcriptional regulator